MTFERLNVFSLELKEIEKKEFPAQMIRITIIIALFFMRHRVMHQNRAMKLYENNHKLYKEGIYDISYGVLSLYDSYFASRASISMDHMDPFIWIE